MMRILCWILLLLSSHAIFAQSDSVPIIGAEDSLYDPFPTLVFDKVVAYNLLYDSASKTLSHTGVHFGKNLAEFNYYQLKKNSLRKLDSGTARDLIKILSDTATYGEQYADCFEPRFGITFFSNGKVV